MSRQFFSRVSNERAAPQAFLNGRFTCPARDAERIPVTQAETFPDALNPRLVRLLRPLAVQFAQPIACGSAVVVSGVLIETVHARGTVHHYRIIVGDVLWLVPPHWLVPSSRLAVTRAEPVPPNPNEALFAAAFQDLSKQWAAKTDEEIAASMAQHAEAGA